MTGGITETVPQSRGKGSASLLVLIQLTALTCAEVRWILENESGLSKTQLVIPIAAIVINAVLVPDQISKAPDI